MNQGTASQRLRPFKPQRFGRYTLLMPISTGGMGEIFLARLEGAHGFDKLCVIKKILPHLAEDPEFVERFVDEARILVKLSHGNIAQVLDMGVQDAAPYIALEFVDGKDLRRVLSRMRDRHLPIPLSFILYSMTRVLDALAYAHRKRGDDDRDLNLVHRDVSPQNVLISYEGEVKVIDFGLAKSTLSSSKTNPSIIMGKFMYMSPEQARHQRADRRSDLYAVGLCLYELVTGHNPFDEVPPGELMAQVANPTIRPLLDLDPLTPIALSDAVAKALNPDPALRFQTAEEFRARLLAILLEIDPAAGPETAARFMREAFAIEYHAERKMLAAVREQADSLEDIAPVRDQAVDDDSLDRTGESLDPDPLGASSNIDGPRPTPLARAMTLVDDDQGTGNSLPKPIEAYQPQARPDAPKAESLSFQPTRKGSAAASATVDKKRLDADRETMPSISAPADELPKRPVAKDQLPTEMAIPIVSMPEPLPSILIDGVPATMEEPAAPTPLPSKRAAARPERAERPDRDPKKRPRAEKTGERKKVERATTTRPLKPPTPVPPAPAPPLASAGPVKSAAKPAPRNGPGVVVWLVLPLLAILAVGAYIAWDLYSESLKAKRLEEEARAQNQRNEAEPDHRSREVKVPGTGEDDLSTLPVRDGGHSTDKDVKDPTKTHLTPKSAPPRTAAATGSPGEQAFRALKSDFERIVDESAAKKYRLKVTKLELELPSRGADSSWVQEVKRLDEEIKGVVAHQ